MLAVAGGAGCRRPRGAQSPFEQRTEELLILQPSAPGLAPGEERRTPALNTQGELMGWGGVSGAVCPPASGTAAQPWSEP